MNNVSGVNETQTDPSLNRRCDVAVGKLQSCAVDLRLIGFDRTLQLLGSRNLSVHLLFGDNSGGEESLVTSGVHGCIVEGGGIFGKLALRLFELDLEGTRVNLNQWISLVDEFAFLEVDNHDLTVNVRMNCDGVGCCDGTESGVIHRKIAGGRCGHDDWNGHTRLPGVRGGGCGLRLLGFRAAEIPYGNADHDKDQHPEPPAPLVPRT